MRCSQKNRLLVERLGIVIADEAKEDLDALEAEEDPLVPAAEDGRLVLALGIAMRSAGV